MKTILVGGPTERSYIYPKRYAESNLHLGVLWKGGSKTVRFSEVNKSGRSRSLTPLQGKWCYHATHQFQRSDPDDTCGEGCR
jgi:hypothetical protein